MHSSSPLSQVASPFLHLMDDSSFSQLKPGFLNSLSDGQKLELLQFHVLSEYVSSSNFDTLTNTVRTLAGAKPGKVQLNVISYRGSVNISTAPAKPSAKTPNADKEKVLSPNSSEPSKINSTVEKSGTTEINVHGKWVFLVLGVLLVTALSS
ncbi:hypothetical protein V8G54_022728 [Vigna mungo]|uniref:FAS1 domain-containing protein n=1 Tax=Vigna mungo TaxID=3915 RepID=A0AAQ3RPN2_VIGMU